MLGCERTTSVSEQHDEARNTVQAVRAAEGVCAASRFLFLSVFVFVFLRYCF